MNDYGLRTRSISAVSLVSYCIKHYLVIMFFALVCAGVLVALHVVKVQGRNRNVDTEVVLREGSSLKQDIQDLNEKVHAVNETRLEAIAQYSNGTKSYSEFKVFNDATNGLLNSLSSEIKSKEAKLSSLEGKTKEEYSIPKFFIIGFLCGALISICFLIVSFSLLNKVSDSEDAEKRLGVPLLGLFFIDNGPLDKLARHIMGERKWGTKEEAIEWFRGNVAVIIPAGSKVALLNSGTKKKNKNAISIIEDILKEDGYTVSTVTNAYQNPLAISSIKESDGVIIIENQFNSKWAQVGYEVDLTNRINKNVFGFVLI